MLSKLNRITTKFQFNIIRKFGSRFNVDYFTATLLKPLKYQGPPKVGFIVSNVIHKKAAKRNRVKRLLREAVRKNLDNIPADHWVSVTVNHKILGKTYAEISDQINRFIQKISSTK
jgi:ribonuclease P protein component